MKKAVMTLLAAILVCTLGATMAISAEGYNYITADELNARLAAGSPMIIVDICPVDQFAKGHIKGSIETNAFPVKTDEEKARLAKILPKIKASGDDLVIVCPRGGGGAKNTVDYYKAGGVEEKRLLILEKGMDNWPFATEGK